MARSGELVELYGKLPSAGACLAGSGFIQQPNLSWVREVSLSRIPRIWLFAAGSLCAVGALVHLAIPLGGAAWYSFVGAPQGLVAMATAGLARPVVSCIVIACALGVFASYAFSALGFIRRLPALRVVLCVIGLGLSARAVWLPVLAATDPRVLGRFCGRCSSLNGFVVATSVLCLFVGIGYLLGAWRPNPTVRPSEQRTAAA